MPLTLLLPAVTVVIALVVLAFGLRRVERELVPLRRSLRRTSATAIAADELGRTTAHVAARAVEVEADVRRRVHTPRGRRRRGAR